MSSGLFPITLSEIVVSKRGKTLLGPLSATLEEGGITVIIGPNGAGKTTLLRVIHGLEHVRGGNITFAEADQDLVRANQSFVFQKPIMLRRSALDNVAYPLQLGGMQKGLARRLAREALDEVGLADASETRATFLSGGEAQKLAIARALVMKPELLILDEPTASLDSSAMRDIERLILKAAKNEVEIIMTTHDMGQARRLARQVIFLNKGRLGEITEASSFWERPQSEDAKRFIDGEIV